ncbi:MAG: hypothetical protein M3Z23_03200, partial [Acidobacteriota bacterium]|nr:hypothetical protein [Acidobacteriota bacterium]
SGAFADVTIELLTEAAIARLEHMLARAVIGGAIGVVKFGGLFLSVAISVLTSSPVLKESLFRAYLPDQTPVSYVVLDPSAMIKHKWYRFGRSRVTIVFKSTATCRSTGCLSPGVHSIPEALSTWSSISLSCLVASLLNNSTALSIMRLGKHSSRLRKYDSRSTWACCPFVIVIPKNHYTITSRASNLKSRHPDPRSPLSWQSVTGIAR